jgi:p25-alpha
VSISCLRILNRFNLTFKFHLCRSGPGINHDSEMNRAESFVGNTNTATDEIIRDIKSIMRPNLRSSSSNPIKKAVEKNYSRWLASEQALLEKTRPQLASQPSQQQQQPVPDIDINTRLLLIFQYYCRFGRTSSDSNKLDSFNFMHFVKESPGMLDDVLTTTEVDLIFLKSKPKTSRRLDFSGFLEALSSIAVVKYCYGEHAVDPLTAFAHLLGTSVFRCPVSRGIDESIKSGLLVIEGKNHEFTATENQNLLKNEDGNHRRGSIADIRESASEELHKALDNAAGNPNLPFSSSPSSLHTLRSMHSDQVDSPSTSSNVLAGLTAPADMYEVILRKTMELKLTGSHSSSPSFTESSLPAIHSPPNRNLSSYETSPLASSLFSASGYKSPSQSLINVRPAASFASRSSELSKHTSSPKYGDQGFKPCIAGEANKPGGVFDRLSSPSHFTGVYKRAWETDGRINHHTEVGLSAKGSAFTGNTNTNTDENIRDISILMRPNLKRGLTSPKIKL